MKTPPPDRREEIVPPDAAECHVSQFAAEHAERLVGMKSQRPQREIKPVNGYTFVNDNKNDNK